MARVTDDQPTPEADCADGGRHPRFAPEVFGQNAAIDHWLEAQASGRRHHAWLLTGPKGIGKATLAWKLAANALGDASGGMFGGPTRDEIARGP
ncbi:MAG: DNA polymerase III subunit delta', partial [Deltaproteobacteria bacterium]